MAGIMTSRIWAGMLALTAVLAIGAGFALRTEVFEWPQLAWRCAGDAPPLGCGLFRGAAAVLRYKAMGFASVVLALWALWGGGRWLVFAAVATGGAGLGLYAPELASAGLLLALLRAVRLSDGPRRQDADAIAAAP